MADPSRQQYFTMNGAVATAAPQWSTVKPGQPVAGNYYPYEWKVEDKKATTTVVKQQPVHIFKKNIERNFEKTLKI
jgi:hypothetical protein